MADAWRIVRNCLSRADVTALRNEAPYDELAEMARLDSRSVRAWLSGYKANSQVRKNDAFTIPNLVVIGIGSVNFVAHESFKRNAHEVQNRLFAKGFRTFWYDYKDRTWTNRDVTTYRADLWGFVYYGHGYEKGGKIFGGLFANDIPGVLRLDSKGNHLLGSSDFVDRKFGLLVLKACGASSGQWAATVSEHGKSYIGHGLEVSAWTVGILDTVDEAISGMSSR